MRARLLLVAALASGCAIAAQRARTRALERELAAWQSPQPLEQVWQQARLLLAERGYTLGPKDAEAIGRSPMSWIERLVSPARDTRERGPFERSLETGWSRVRDRYRVECRPRGGDGGWQIVFLRIEEAMTDRPGEPSRDVELELALVRRVDPAGAARIDGILSAPVATSR
jgi:hypothetical protein